MFGNMFGDMEEKQEALEKKLAEMTIEAESGEGAIKVTSNGLQQIKNIKINKELLDWDDVEQLEDLLLIAINRALDEAGEIAAEESEKLMRDMLPPGFDNLGNLFG